MNPTTLKPVPQDQPTGSASIWSMAGAVVAAILASLCCVLPLVLIAFGLGGAWAANFAALEPYRPLLLLVTLGLLGAAFYFAYRSPRSCEADGSCAVPRSIRIRRLLLWIVALMVLGLLAFPYVSAALINGRERSEPSMAASAEAGLEQVVLEISGMTCAGCAATAEQALEATEGVREARVTFDPPEALVIYDPATVTAEQLAAVVTEVGYPTESRL